MAKVGRYTIWAHRDANSIFGPASSPIIRNGSLFCFEDETSAKVECDRLNARAGNAHVRYSVGNTTAVARDR
jgi:hypothetical protein